MSGSRKQPNNEAVVVKGKKRKGNNDAVTQTGHYGLHNQGTTCYLNSVLQVLSMTTELHDGLEPKSQTTSQERIVVFKKRKDTCQIKNMGKSLATENDESSPKLKTSTCKMTPLCISHTGIGCVSVVILIVVLAIVYS